MYGVIVDSISTDLIKFKLSGRLTGLDEDGMKEIAEFLAETSDAWKDVVKGSRAGVIFDGETMDKIRYNDGVVKLILNP